ncbi:hypothetical protein HHX47_DHR1001872 [Lentinula edodes]|nr:hypothetical protein HHX47_DHR1001872 [Lentinula edodes]
MSLSSPESSTFTTFESSPSPNSSATSVSNEEELIPHMHSTTIVAEGSGSVYDYAQLEQQPNLFSGTDVWNSTGSKKTSLSSQLPLSIYIPQNAVAGQSTTRHVQGSHPILSPDDEEWARSQNATLSTTPSISSPLANAVDCRQEYPDYFSYSYTTDAPEGTGRLQSRAVQGALFDDTKRHTSPFQYEYSMQYKQTAVSRVVSLEEQEQACDPRFVSGHEVGGMEVQDADVKPSQEEEADADSDMSGRDFTEMKRHSHHERSLAGRSSLGLTYPSSFPNTDSHISSQHDRHLDSYHRGSQGGQDLYSEEEEDGEVESDEYDYDDPSDGEYVFRDRSRAAQPIPPRQLGHTASFSTASDKMGLDNMQGGATGDTTASGRRRAATESAGSSGANSYSSFSSSNYASGSSAYDWNNHPNPPYGVNPNATSSVGMRTRAGTTVGYSTLANRYSPYPHGSNYDEYPMHHGSSRSRRTSYSSEASSAGPLLSANSPPTSGIPLSPSISSSSSMSADTAMGTPHVGSPNYSGPGGRRKSNSLPVPIPIPNLTKKSRGRRVPTASTLDNSTRKSVDLDYSSSGGRGGKGVRVHTCKVPGCGKCFARGEHLKRHVRSIHTYDKQLQHQIDSDSARWIRYSLRGASAGAGSSPSSLLSPSKPIGHLPAKIKQAYAEIEQLSTEKLALAERVVDLITRTYTRLGVDLNRSRVLQGELPTDTTRSRSVSAAPSLIGNVPAAYHATVITDGLKQALNSSWAAENRPAVVNTPASAPLPKSM